MFQVEGTWAGALHWGKAFRVLRKAKEAGVESGEGCEEVRVWGWVGIYFKCNRRLLQHFKQHNMI